MSKTGPILIIEDDPDDAEMFMAIAKDLKVPNELIWFENTEEAFDYLVQTKEIVFVIFCDINLPGTNGLTFKRTIEEHPALRKKSIPFMFFSTTAKPEDVNEAFHDMIVQGFFQKPSDYSELKFMLSTIFNYWKLSHHPNSIK